MSIDKVIPMKPKAIDQNTPWTIEELEETIRIGQEAHQELTQAVSNEIAQLSRMAHQIGRYQELLLSMRGQA